MAQNTTPVAQYYYSEQEWNRLGCGPLPDSRKCENLLEDHVKKNLKINSNPVKKQN
jgi:hypothetical protein